MDAALTPRGIASGAPTRERDTTIDVLRGLTIAAVVAYHFHADLRGLDVLPDLRRDLGAALARLDPLAALGSVAATLVAAPAYRLDLFLFVTGLVLSLAPRRPLGEFLKRRARDVLPNYWMGSALVAACLVGLAALRSAALHTPLRDEIHAGTRLAHQPYLFEPGDLLRSLSIVGRFRDPRTFQVVAPSMWYVMLLLQAYLVFPFLRWLRERTGDGGFLAVVLGFTWAGRAWVFRADPLPSFGPNPTVLYLVPFRLAPLALGMVASARLSRLALDPPRWLAHAGAAAALAWVAVTFWLSAAANRPGTVAGVIGPVAPLALGLPALWWIAIAARRTPGLGAILTWSGRHSLSILVVQDVLRLAIGTYGSLATPLEPYLWPLLVPYLAACIALARAWDPLATRTRDRLWPKRVSR